MVDEQTKKVRVLLIILSVQYGRWEIKWDVLVLEIEPETHSKVYGLSCMREQKPH